MDQYSHMQLNARRRIKSRSLSPSPGTCNLAYDANNRPTSFTSEDGQTVIACGYDYMGRRFMKKITIGGNITVHQRYLYRGYLQIAALDLTSSQLPVLSFIYWDPTEPNATRPLSIRKNETWYSYGQDLTKNVTELYKADGTIASTYDYTPYGAVTATGIEQPLQWSSEVYDTELGMVYYNYRYLNVQDGRWISRDPSGEAASLNLYSYLNNSMGFDWLGLANGGAPGSLQDSASQGVYTGVFTGTVKNKATGETLTITGRLKGATTIKQSLGAKSDETSLSVHLDLAQVVDVKISNDVSLTQTNGKMNCCIAGAAQWVFGAHTIKLESNIKTSNAMLLSAATLSVAKSGAFVKLGNNSQSCVTFSAGYLRNIQGVKLFGEFDLSSTNGKGVMWNFGLSVPVPIGGGVMLEFVHSVNQNGKSESLVRVGGAWPF